MIVRMTKQHAKTVAKLADQMWDAGVEKLTAEFEEMADSPNHAVFLYYIADEAVAFVHCSLRYEYVEGTDRGPVGYLEGIYVKEPYRRREIAKQLVDHCEAWARRNNCTAFASDCEIDNLESLALHLKMGFLEVSRNIHFVKEL